MRDGLTAGAFYDITQSETFFSRRAMAVFLAAVPAKGLAVLFRAKKEEIWRILS